jgi:hypothetical protein
MRAADDETVEADAGLRADDRHDDAGPFSRGATLQQRRRKGKPNCACGAV